MIYINSMITERSTRYTQAAMKYMESARHATNGQILDELRHTYPDLSATTVHRITTRMLERGELICALPTTDKLSRFDVNTTQHNHFHCL
jgi:Fe2+ or Zn2+ uptake regulation protein